jgi:hypothetical protein
MTNDEKRSITVTLSPAQVDHVVRAASEGRAPSIATLVSNLLAAPLPDGRDGSSSHAERPTAAAGPAGAKGPTGTGGPAAAGGPKFGGYLPTDDVDPRLSRSLLRGLSILTRFGPDGAPRGIVELAHDLGMSPSTAHRYAATLVELGLLERCPKTRKYRLAGS